MIDTTAIDSKITLLTSNLTTAQANLDNDLLTISLNKNKALADIVNNLKIQIQSLKDNKTQLLALDAKTTPLLI